MDENHVNRILVVDDNADNRNALVEHLQAQGNKMLVAGDGEEALKTLHSKPVDLVLLGLGIPKINGHQVLEHMKADSDLRDIAVIVVSSASSPDSIVRCIQLGADDYIREPFSMALLDTRIHVILEKQRLRAAQRESLEKAERIADLMERVILPMGVALSAETDFDRLLERIVMEAKSVCNADAGTLYMRTENDRLRFAIVRTESLGIELGGTSGKPVSFPTIPLYLDDGNPNHHNVASHVALTGHSVNIPDIYTVEGFDFSATKVFDRQNNYRSVSSLTVPLKDNKGDTIGVMQLLNAQDENGEIIPFDEYNRLIVASLASQAAVVLNNHLLIQHQQKMNKIENDIQIARTIQKNFLPSTMPDVRGWEVDARFQPAREVAGDFYDVFKMGDKKLAFMIADVCDKGVGAALFMSLTRSLLRAFSMENFKWMEETTEMHALAAEQDIDLVATGGGTLHSAVTNTNNYITEHHLELNMFATLFFGVLDIATGKMVYINGGHCPPMIISRTCQVKTRLEATGAAVGMFPGMTFELAQAKLDYGDILLAYTDGITDARNIEGKLFGEANLLDLLNPPAETVNALVDRIENALQNYIGDAVQFDDITMLAIRRE
ncbi:MAG: SpoIIE family protein phosphatase [Anaerolineae bacterium]|nr:SpoIIE family protein phosphatase [Anaerolineae bacterium]